MNTIAIKDQTLAYVGDASMLLCPLTTFLCSHRVPDGVAKAIRQWVDGLDAANSCVVCGNLTAEERFASRLLAERGVPVVLALATAIPERLDDLQLTPAEVAALNAGLMVIVSPILDLEVTGASGRSSAARNRFMIAIADQIIVGFMTANGNLARQLLGNRSVTVLKDDATVPAERNQQKRQSDQTQMGWAIYRRLKAGAEDAPDSPDSSVPVGTNAPMPWEGQPLVTPLPSLEMRQLLAQYLQLTDIERPSLLHSLVLFQVVSKYAQLPDFNFTAFFRLWGADHLRPEDWRSQKVGDHWLPSLAERVMARLFKAMPSKFHQPVNAQETFDPQLAHALVDKALARPGRKPNERLLHRALSLAYFEHDSEAIARYRQQLPPK